MALGTEREAIGDNGDRGLDYSKSGRDVTGKFMELEPGSTILIPVRRENHGAFNVDQFLTRTLSIIAAVATVSIAVRR